MIIGMGGSRVRRLRFQVQRREDRKTKREHPGLLDGCRQKELLKGKHKAISK